MKKTFLFKLLFLLIIFSINVSGNALLDDMAHYYNLNNSQDIFSTFNFVNSGVTFNAGIIGLAGDFDAGDFLTMTNSSFIINNESLTINLWVKIDSSAHLGNGKYQTFISRNCANSWMCPLDIRWKLSAATDELEFAYGEDGSGTFGIFADEMDGNWHMITIIIDGSRKSMLLDSVFVYNVSDSQVITDDTSEPFRLGRWAFDNLNDFDGKIDEVGIWNRALNPSNISYLWNGGASVPFSNFTTTPTPPTPPSTGNRVEAITEFSQISPLTIGSSSFVDVLAGNFNISNATQVYGSFVTNSLFLNNVNPPTIQCRLTIDGDDLGSTVTRSNSGILTFGSIQSTTRNQSFTTPSSPESKVQCAGSSPVNFQISNTNVLIHQLADATGEELNYAISPIFTSFNESSLTKVFEFSIITENTTLTNQVRTIVLEGGFDVDYTDTSNLTYQWVVGNSTNNVTCGTMKRFGTPGTIGNAGDICAFIGAPQFQNVTAKLFVSGNASLAGGLILKEFITNSTEVQYENLNDVTVSNSEFESIANLRLSTNTTQSLVYIAAVSGESNTGANDDLIIRFNISSENSSDMIRTYMGGQEPGMSMLQGAFNTLPPGEYNIDFQATASDSKIINANLFIYFATDEPFLTNILNITAISKLDGTPLTNFTVIYDSSSTTDQGTGLVQITTLESTLNITIIKEGYVDTSFTDVSTSIALEAQVIQPGIYNTTLDNFFVNAGQSFARNLSYSINYTCKSGFTSNIMVFLDDIINTTQALTCDETFNFATGNIGVSSEGLYELNFQFNTSYFPNINNANTTNFSFIQDNVNPQIFINLSIDTGFVRPNATLAIRCLETVWTGDIQYNNTFNEVNLELSNQTNNTEILNEAFAIDGTNTQVGICSDPFGSTKETQETTVFTNSIFLIDERLNIPFDVLNLTSVKLFFDDNSTFIDLKTQSINSTNFTSTLTTKLRLELEYADGSIITRYVDSSLFSGDIRICANVEGVTHFEQILISTQEQAVILKSVFSNCVVAADFTRFAFQDALSLKAFTIATFYKLFKFDQLGNQILLASVDGSVQTFINIDTIEFAKQGYNTNIKGDSLSFEKISNSSVSILYTNLDEDNEEITLIITRLDTNEVVLIVDETDLTNLNSFTIVFDWSTLSPLVNETTMFQVDVERETIFGESFEFTVYFNGAGSSGKIMAQFAALIAVFLMVLGLPLGATNQTFSWLGLVLTIAALGILSIAIGAWYTIFLQAIALMLSVFIFITMIGQNQATLAS